MNAFEISLSGLDVEWQRLQVISQNLANINSTRDAGGRPYQAVRLLSGPASNFAQALQRGEEIKPEGVRTMGVETISGTPRREFEPSHPHADEDGFVTYPDIDRATEMTLMIKTSRAYEANLTAMSIAQQMYRSALEIGRQQ